MKPLKLLCLVLPLTLIAAGCKSKPEKANELSKSLLQASANGDVDKVKSLLSKGADVDAQDWEGTALHIAAQYDHKEVVESLIAAGADVNARLRSSVTPLHCAAVYGHKDIADLLINKGADVKSTDALGYTPLHFAASGGHRDVAELLIAKGVEVNDMQAQGLTPLHEAAKWGHTDFAELLINKGANVNAKDKDGRTPLWYAKAGRNEEIVKLLPKYGPDHDVAVTNISVPSFFTQGDHVSVVVNVVNTSDYSETLTVTLTDVTDDVRIGTKSVYLSPVGVDGMDEICDLAITGEEEDATAYSDHIAVGDVNRDGYDDILVSAARYNDSRGKAYLYYGGANMDDKADKIFTGENTGDGLSKGGAHPVYLADMNKDGFDDVIIGARDFNNSKGRVYIFYGGADMDVTPDIIIEGEAPDSEFGHSIAVGDVNGDGELDLIVGADKYEGYKGRAYLYYGPIVSDTAVDKIFTGEATDDTFAMAMTARGDVDGDGCDDLLIGTLYWPKYTNRGRAYLYYGATGTGMDEDCDLTFNAENDRDNFAVGLDLFDIDNDGFADVLITARKWPYGRLQGRAYLYWGSSRATMDNVADKIFTGEAGVKSELGGNTVYGGYVNNDNYGDIYIAAYGYLNSDHRGRGYLYYGNTKALMDEVCDHTFSESQVNSSYGKEGKLADLNGDGLDDVILGAWRYNYLQGRVYLYYSEPRDLTDVTFCWDTTKASKGEHSLEATIGPVAGEEDTADNTMTTTVDLKGPSQERQRP